jgi:hypothetical protein
LQKNFLYLRGCRTRGPARLRILAGAALAVILCAAAVWADQKPCLQGTFLQLTEAQGHWQSAEWGRLFGYFKALRLSRLIIQWTVYDDLAFFPMKGLRQVSTPPLPAILQLADAAGLKVWVGLAYDSGFWEKIKRDPKLVEIYLRRLRRQAEAIAGQLAPQLQNHPSFGGWYLTTEVDDVNWQEDRAREVLFAFLRDLSAYLHRLTPGARVAISGFSNARTDPKTFGRFWRALLGAASIDAVFFQDGIGTGKLGLEELPLYLGSLRQAVQAQARELQVVVELFRQVSERPFRAQPASWQSVAGQLEIAARFATNGILAFSVPEYMTPLGGAEADRLYNSYLGFLRSR